ncbi:MAG: hypothetical protein JO362_02715 [Streptomycetaceae bacterium]|nr:hypothetical protein [Streptomycetaceae bacterium]
MPHTDQRRPRPAGTVAVFAASALLASIGIGLLLYPPSAAHRSAAHPGPTASPEPSTPVPPTATSAALAAASASPGSSAPPTQTPLALPEPIAAAARAFTVAWAGHDARPGHDSSFNDAARRAAAYAGKQLAAQLTTASPGAARQWDQWTAERARVTAQITTAAVPDGAPAPTPDAAYVRVRYRLTVTPATGRPTTTDQQVALELQPDQAGTWLVTSLPNA